MERRPQYADMFTLENKLLPVFGVYSKKTGGKRSLWKKLVVSTMLCFSVGMWLCMLTYIVLNRKSPFEVIDTGYFFMTQTGYLVKISSFLLRQPLLLKLEKLIKSELFNSQHPEQDKFIYDAIDNHNFYGRLLFILAFSTVTFFALFPIIDKRDLIVKASFPVDTQTYRLALIAFEATCIFLNAFNHISVDCLGVGFISVGIAQYEILKDNLENRIANEALRGNETVAEKMKKCVIHHIAILRFLDDVQGVFSVGICFQILGGIAIICLTGIQFLFIPVKSAQFVCLFLYFITMIGQVAIYCYFGHDLFTKSSGVVLSCYMSDWVTYTIPERKILMIIIERAQRPVILTAGFIFTLTLQTLLMILRNSYSYFAVLRRMYN